MTTETNSLYWLRFYEDMNIPHPINIDMLTQKIRN